MKSVIKPLGKSVLIPLRLTAASSAADAGIHKNFLGSGQNNTTLIISNDEKKDIIKIVNSLEDSGLLLKGVSETVQNEAKEQKRRFIIMILGTLGASLLGNLLAGKGAIATRQDRGINRTAKGRGINGTGEGIVRGGYGNKKQNHKKKMDFQYHLIL